MKKLAKGNVFIMGMDGLGIEIGNLLFKCCIAFL